jgi:hypothetical protein
MNALSSQSNSAERIEFEAFVNDMELEDIPSLGRKFTWFHPNGVSMSRIDRALVSEDWISLWGSPSLWILPRSVSDHCPLVLRHRVVYWGPKPFRFKNHWLHHSDFKTLVEDFWKSHEVVGWMDFVLKEKLKGLKAIIKAWNMDVYGIVDAKIMLLVEEIQMLDLQGEVAGLRQEEVERRKKLFGDLWHLLKSKDSLIVQKSRARWLREGDANSKYFHNCIKSRVK